MTELEKLVELLAQLTLGDDIMYLSVDERGARIQVTEKLFRSDPAIWHCTTKERENRAVRYELSCTYDGADHSKVTIFCLTAKLPAPE